MIDFNIKKLEIIPNIKKFNKAFLSKKYNRLCLWTEISADLETPITAYLKLIKKNNNNNFLLESVEGGSSRGRYSIIGIESDKLIKCTNIDKKTLIDLKKEISSLKTCTFGKLPSMVSSYVGFMGYDFIRYYENLPKKKRGYIKNSICIIYENLISSSF